MSLKEDDNNGDQMKKITQIDAAEVQVPGVICMFVNDYIIAPVTSRKTSTRSNRDETIPYIPKEIIFSILVWLPAEIIHNVMRYVCQDWFTIISDPVFVNKPFPQSTTALLLRNKRRPELHLVELRECDVKKAEIRFPFDVVYMASCNALILILFDDSDTLRVANPITKQQMTIPSLPSNHAIMESLYGLTYAASTREYKVACTCRDHCAKILSLGVDRAWRSVSTTHISSTVSEVFSGRTISIGGFIHWFSCNSPYILSLDAESETFHQSTLPRNEKIRHFLAHGSSLSAMADLNGYSWEVWVLREVRTGVWTKLPNVDIQGIRSMYKLRPYAYPVLWLKNGGWLVFRNTRCILALFTMSIQEKVLLLRQMIMLGSTITFQWYPAWFGCQIVNSFIC